MKRVSTGRGDMYIVREWSPYSLASMEDYALGGFFKKLTKSIGKVFAGVGKVIGKTVAAIAKPVGRIVAAPIKVMAALMPVKGVQKVLKKVAGVVEKAALPAVLNIIPGVGTALSIAVSGILTAKSVYDANKANKAAKANMENQIAGAYGTYKQEVAAAGYKPVEQAVFRSWALAGGTGQMPIGEQVSQPGQQADQPGQQMDVSSIVPLAFVGLAGLLLLKKR
jgi:hypothetical protein